MPTPTHAEKNSCRRARRLRRGFSVTELIIVIGIIAVLLALLIPSLASIRNTGKMTSSMNNLRQVSQHLSTYAQDYREIIVPSQWNYHDSHFPGYPRCGPPFFGEWHSRGTWTDILWVKYDLGVYPEGVALVGHDYELDSPDEAIYRATQIDANILRSTSLNSKNVPDGTGMLPFGTGAQEQGLPGFFACNQFFNADDETDTYNGYWTFGQIRAADRSMYLVDSFAGEVIEDEPDPFDTAKDSPTGQVDFRYHDQALLLMLDGHTRLETAWGTLDELEADRGIKVRELDKR